MAVASSVVFDVPFLRLNATVGTTSSLHWPEVRTLTNEVLPDACGVVTQMGTRDHGAQRNNLPEALQLIFQLSL